jgi:hypothetical protein
MIDYRLYLDKEWKKLSSERESLLKKLGDIQLYDENDIMEQLEEVNIKMAVLRAEFKKLDDNDSK